MSWVLFIVVVIAQSPTLAFERFQSKSACDEAAVSVQLAISKAYSDSIAPARAVAICLRGGADQPF